MTSVVFLGPTLADAPGCLVLPPARQGDVFRAVQAHRPHAVGLVDGLFLDVPAVWHREILWALSQGVHVLGAASMGALRAAELDRFGMRGVGAIYQAYRDGIWPGFAAPFEDDDEVAVEHAPPEAGGAALSTSMADLRATLRGAVAAGILDEERCSDLAAVLKRLPFGQRSRAALAGLAGTAGAWLDANPVHQKRQDAQALLDALATLPQDRFRPDFTFTRAAVWERFVAVQARPSAELDRLPQATRARLRACAAARLAALAGLPPASETAAKAALGAFRTERGLDRAADLEAWLGRANLAWPDLARLMHEEATLAASTESSHESPRLRAAMCDILALRA